MKRSFTTTILTVAMTAAMGITAFAGQWNCDSVGWWWSEDNGSYPVNEWRWLDGNSDGISECYYFGDDGYMAAGTITPDGYQVNEDGAWITDGVVETRNTDVSDGEETPREYTSYDRVGTYTSENGDCIVINIGIGDSLAGMYYNSDGDFENIYNFSKTGTDEYKDSSRQKSIRFLEDGSLFMNNRIYS